MRFVPVPDDKFTDAATGFARRVMRAGSFRPMGLIHTANGQLHAVEVNLSLLDPGTAGVSEPAQEQLRVDLSANRAVGVAFIAEAWAVEGGIEAFGAGHQDGGVWLPWPAVVIVLEHREVMGGERLYLRAAGGEAPRGQPTPFGEFQRVVDYPWPVATAPWLPDPFAATAPAPRARRRRYA